MTQTHTWDVDITLGGAFCSWIEGKGGPLSLALTDVLHCLQAFKTNPPQGDVTFKPSLPQVLYTLQYWKVIGLPAGEQQQRIDEIDVNSGCDF